MWFAPKELAQGRFHTMDRDRSGKSPDADEVSVRLIRKYAEMIDGVNLENASVGDRLHLRQREAEMLIAEGWAEPDRKTRLLPRRSIAADSSSRRSEKKR
jgi:hypothetical protein